MNEGTLRVLLVEDTPAQAELIREVLARLSAPSYKVEHVSRAKQGIARLRAHDYDVMLLDLTLPDSEGPGGVRKMRAAAGNVPIIVLTNLEDEEIAATCVRDGAQDYLIKREVSPRLLARAIRYARERQSSEEALRESEQRYALAVAGANDGLWDWNFVCDTVYFSPRWKGILGFTDAELGSSIDEWFGRIADEDRIGFRAALKAHLDGRSQHLEFEHRIIGKDDTELWVRCRGLAVRDERGQVTRLAGSMSDISQRKRAEAQLVHDALHDALTTLPNRALIMDRLMLSLKRYQRNAADRFAVLYFDLDRFKTINDSLGHLIGDELLVEVARRVEKFLRPGDTLARLGGDEFAILVHAVHEIHHATHVAERVHEILEEGFVIRGQQIHVSASVGIAFSAPHYQKPEELLRDADLAMYRAKNAGRGRYEIFDTAMHESALALHRIETDLRQAVKREEFMLHYQPIVVVDSGRIQGFEALLRWEHPQWGLVSPDYFIDVAEETGLIVPIGWWVLEESCRQAQKWQESFPADPPLAMSVNVSGKLIVQSDSQKRIVDILQRTGLSATSLRLEITESAVMNHGVRCVGALSAFREMGIQLHVDDFGTGYSSLTYLQKFAYDSLKIDKSFVSAINAARQDSAIVGAIIGLGESLGIKVIAEGVETEQQLETLRDMGCPEAQGFWFSRPLDHAGIGALLSSPSGLKC